MEYAWKIFQKFWQVVMGFLAAFVLLIIWLYEKLWQLYDPEDFVFFGLIGAGLFILGYVLRLSIRNVQFLDDYYFRIKQNSSPARTLLETMTLL